MELPVPIILIPSDKQTNKQTNILTHRTSVAVEQRYI